MAQEQTTHGTWVKYTDDGVRLERVAYSPADVVKFRFDGWERQDQMPAQPGPITRGATAPKPATVTRSTTVADTRPQQ